MNEANDDAKVPIPEMEGEDLKLTVEKLKKVIQIFQSKLKNQAAKVAEITKQSEMKDRIITAAKENLERIQKERDAKAKSLDELKSKKGGNSLESFEGQTPESVLERIQVGSDAWCLVKFPEGEQKDSDFDDDEYHDSNCIWITQDELIDHVNTIGCTLDLPPFSLSSVQAAGLRSELISLQQSKEQLEEEYKKYRVDMDVMIWNKNSQIESLKSTNTELPLYSTSQAVRISDDVETMHVQRQAMKEMNMQLSNQIENMQTELEETKLTVADDKRQIELLKSECDEWRRKYKDEIKKKQSVVIDTEMGAVNDKEAIESLKQELAYLRSKNEQMVMMVRKSRDGKSSNTAQISSINVDSQLSTPLSVPDIDVNSNDILTKNKYLRSLFYNYLCARDKSSRNHMQTALMTIFQFSPEEVIEIRKKAQAQWF